jgi:hypothetical protein
VAIAKRKRRKRLEFDAQDFPNLTNANHRVTSDPVEEQNCIAFAIGDKIRWWWPIPDFPGPLPSPYFWPLTCPLEATIEAFVFALGTVGFESCPPTEDGRLEDHVEKIAIFSTWVSDKAGVRKEPTHAAIQSPLRNGKWRSKMGADEDIEHDTLAALAGKLYGEVDLFMKRPFAARKAALARLRQRMPSH